MSRRAHYLSLDDILRRIKEDRGAGQGLAYRPWFEIKDVPSLGRRHRIRCSVNGRVVHLLSDLEGDCLHFGEYTDQCLRRAGVGRYTDVREQYPLLPLEETWLIARELGIRHPAVRGQKIVMTTDMVWTYERTNDTVLVPVSVKYLRDKNNPRSQQKAAIEAEYWRRRGYVLEHHDETCAGRIFRKNWTLIRPTLRPEFFKSFPSGIVQAVDECLRKPALGGRLRLTDLAAIGARRLGYSKGQVITAIHRLIADQTWPTDLMSQSLVSLEPLILTPNTPS
ncbi:MAG: TnsA endonuclease N-terminal domain-containing protein [Opitutaceae bacterium]|nr:TnsA endonuclease N-terminal domain-containing protein [Opitutaceae bacterium]